MRLAARLLLACAVPAALPAADPAAFPNAVGVYHWGGAYSTSVSSGVTAIAGLNGRLARIILSSRYLIDYHRSDSCMAQFSLATALDDPDVADALANPAITVFMITAFDGASFADCQHQYYLVPGFYTPENRAAIVQEYSDFVFRLYRDYQGSGKRFIISSWEGDNSVYCGDAFDYAVHPQSRADCDSTYATVYYGNAGPPDSIEGMRRWFQARWDGIADGKARAAAAGWGGMDVFCAFEFNIVHVLHDGGLPSILYDVIPAVPFDYVSYSAYESIDKANPADELAADLDLIRDVAGSANVIVGEAGFQRSLWGDAAVPLTAQVIDAALSWGVPYLFLWNLYDQDAANNFGLFDAQGALTPMGAYYRDRLAQSQLCETRPQTVVP